MASAEELVPDIAHPSPFEDICLPISVVYEVNTCLSFCQGSQASHGSILSFAFVYLGVWRSDKSTACGGVLVAIVYLSPFRFRQAAPF